MLAPGMGALVVPGKGVTVPGVPVTGLIVVGLAVSGAGACGAAGLDGADDDDPIGVDMLAAGTGFVELEVVAELGFCGAGVLRPVLLFGSDPLVPEPALRCATGATPRACPLPGTTIAAVVRVWATPQSVTDRNKTSILVLDIMIANPPGKICGALCELSQRL